MGVCSRVVMASQRAAAALRVDVDRASRSRCSIIRFGRITHEAGSTLSFMGKCTFGRSPSNACWS